MISEKKSVQFLHKFCLDLEIVDWVISPGSRNAPITLTFANDNRFNAVPVVDERSAAFIALGKALKKGVPAAITCTSGSAALNYAPAIAEAFYQEVPMLIVTADRPQKWINNGEGQSIDQVDVFENYCLSSFHLNEDDDEKVMEDVFQELTCILFGKRKGPVHLNLAFDEPLYGKLDSVVMSIFSRPVLKESDWSKKEVLEKFSSKRRIMILVGQMEPNERLEYLLTELLADKRITVLTETNANVAAFHFVNCIDRTLPPLEKEEFHPELVITIGGAIVSKRIKKYLRSIEGLEHWHVSSSGTFPNTFEALSESIELAPEKFFRRVLEVLSPDSLEVFQNHWVQRSMMNKENHDNFLNKVEWSDLKAHSLIYDWLPDGVALHQGNSSVVRYFQLFDAVKSITYQSNRGVSGIDGIVSTAIGYASEDEGLNVVVVGDLSFQYDINALWNKIDKSNVLIILINNGGGGIFKIIDGPSKTGVLEEYFEVKSSTDFKKLVEAYQINYTKVEDETSLDLELQRIMIDYFNGVFKGQVLEVNTGNVRSEDVLKSYFTNVNPQ